MEIHHFAYGALTPTLAYVMSCVGSLLGLLCTTRAQVLTGRPRIQWLMGGALAIGGTGIWVMHFIAMLGFSVSTLTIRYDIALTLISAVVAVVFVGIGLYIAGARKVSTGRLLVGGLITGLGVAAMHYTGIAAMRMNAEVDYNPGVVALSIVIAIVAATAALWAALHLRRTWATVGASLIMGVAVSAMHYTGILAMSVGAGKGGPTSGAGPLEFLVPIIIGLSLSTICLLTALAAAPTRWEIQREAELMEQIGGQHNGGRPIWLDTFDPPRLGGGDPRDDHAGYYRPTGYADHDAHHGQDGAVPQYGPNGDTAQYGPNGGTPQYGPNGDTAQYGPNGGTPQYGPNGGAVDYAHNGGAHYDPHGQGAQYDTGTGHYDPDGPTGSGSYHTPTNR